MARWSGTYVNCDPVGERLGSLAPGRHHHIKKKQRLRTLGECPHGLALADGLKTRSNGRGVETLKHGSVAHDVDFLYGHVAARRVRHPQLVDKMGAAVRSHEGHRSIMHREQKRAHVLRGACPRARSNCNDKRWTQHEGCYRGTSADTHTSDSWC
jgi:cobyrinic acid a,c-diamide synthase